MSATDGDLSYRVVYDFATVPDVERDAAIVAVDIPELCFQALNGGRAMQHPKKSAEGHAARLALLRECGFGPIADAALAALPRGVEAACQSDQSRA